MAGNWGNTNYGGVTSLSKGNLGQSSEDGANLGTNWNSKSEGTESLIKGGAGNAQRSAHSGLASASIAHANNVSLVASSWSKGEQAQGQTIDEHGSIQTTQAGEAVATDSSFKRSITG